MGLLQNSLPCEFEGKALVFREGLSQSVQALLSLYSGKNEMSVEADNQSI